ncbi:MAG: alpha/beta hydrolase, partial [Polaromonas sp.]|nr:alpha/beta hydrolase [Polaromonas sp.]
GFQVRAIEKFGHDPRYPVTNNWPHLVQQLADFSSEQVEKSGQAAFLVGHSLGGFLSLMCAARNPLLGGQPVRGVLLIDSPILGGWRAAALSVAKRAQLVGSISPGAISRKRKHQWLGRDEVLAHFRSKKAFARWDEQVLLDYIEHGTHDAQGEGDNQRLLSFDRDVETAIYNTLPHNLEGLLKRHPLKCPVAFIGGHQSAEMKQVGMAMTEKVARGRIMMLDGSHLFPMEKPLATAAAIEASLRNLMV